MPKYHKYSVEKLYHFQCYDCEGWWSVGDWKVAEKMVCPHCGRVAVVIEDHNNLTEEIKRQMQT